MVVELARLPRFTDRITRSDRTIAMNLFSLADSPKRLPGWQVRSASR
jgi:hypothetical protein